MESPPEMWSSLNAKRQSTRIPAKRGNDDDQDFVRPIPFSLNMDVAHYHIPFTRHRRRINYGDGYFT
ncbi:hypothetical protein Trydic_g13733 [Trypoxylus dichotomus]